MTRRVGIEAPTERVPDFSEGACFGHPDPDMWFPTASSKDQRRAVAVCRECPIRVACASWAIDNEQHGIWGGLSENAREELRRRTA